MYNNFFNVKRDFSIKIVYNLYSPPYSVSGQCITLFIESMYGIKWYLNTFYLVDQHVWYFSGDTTLQTSPRINEPLDQSNDKNAFGKIMVDKCIAKLQEIKNDEIVISDKEPPLIWQEVPPPERECFTRYIFCRCCKYKTNTRENV